MIWDAKTFSHYALRNEFMTFSDSEKIRKLMPTWLQKWYQNLQKSTMGPPRVDVFVDFIDFGPCRRIVVFSMALRVVQKSTKISPGAPKGRFCRSGRSSPGAFFASRLLGPPRARGLVKKKTAEEQLVEDLTRMGRWPCDFFHLMFFLFLKSLWWLKSIYVPIKGLI